MPTSGIGLALAAAQARGPMKVGVIGLGTGTLAAYGRKGDDFRFYEINPQVVRVARGLFGYLGDTQARVRGGAGRRAPEPGARERGRRRASTCSRSTRSRAIRSRCT